MVRVDPDVELEVRNLARGLEALETERPDLVPSQPSVEEQVET